MHATIVPPLARRPWGRLVVGALAAGASILVGAPVASAHVGVDQDRIVAGASTTLTFAFGHGCDGSPTREIAFQVPEPILNAQALVHPGWDVVVERAALATPAEVGHGEEVTDRPSVITFTARPGNEIPDELRDTFSLSFTAPEALGTLAFKTVQRCTAGEHAWIEEWDGTGDEPDSPAPSVEVVAAASSGDAAGDDHGHDEPAAATTIAVDDHAAAGDHDATAGDGDDDGDDGSNGLAIAALVVGGLGLVVGGVALARSRRSTTA